ncbi:MAG: Ltp family lipoprotein, partial [Staphylococcus epidermidis]|nr:Ltp family lipoprotein [Staphylococcus epidermidis]
KSLYKQLTSEYGEKYPADVAQYAVDHISVDYKKNALRLAKSYVKNINISNQALYDQLVSENGEGFTPEEAQYAMNHLDR